MQRILEYEISLGSTAEAYRARVSLGPERDPKARCMRLGLLTLGFVTENGDGSGILVRDGDGTFDWKTGLGFSERWGLKRGLEILERRRPPVFIRFPVHLGRIERAGKEAP